MDHLANHRLAPPTIHSDGADNGNGSDMQLLLSLPDTIICLFSYLEPTADLLCSVYLVNRRMQWLVSQPLSIHDHIYWPRPLADVGTLAPRCYIG